MKLHDLRQQAQRTDSQNDWHQLWQTVAGSRLTVPLTATAGETANPLVVSIDGLTAVQAFEGMERYAEMLDAPGDYAQIDGAELAAMLDGQDVALAIIADESDLPIVIPADTLSWIAHTFQADVERVEGAGVAVREPELPAPEVVALLGQSVAALGANCPEAWLVTFAEPDGTQELVLVLGLSDDVREMEGQIADTVTRAVQSGIGVPISVACPDRGSALMDQARRVGIGIGG